MEDTSQFKKCKWFVSHGKHISVERNAGDMSPMENTSQFIKCRWHVSHRRHISARKERSIWKVYLITTWCREKKQITPFLIYYIFVRFNDKMSHWWLEETLSGGDLGLHSVIRTKTGWPWLFIISIFRLADNDVVLTTYNLIGKEVGAANINAENPAKDEDDEEEQKMNEV